MVCASFIVDATPGRLRAASDALREIDGVTVHNSEGFKIIVTLRVSSADEYDAALDRVSKVPGVVSTSLLYREDGV